MSDVKAAEKRSSWRSSPWVVSLILHGALLALLGVITLVVSEPEEPDLVLTLGVEEGAEVDEGAGDLGETNVNDPRGLPDATVAPTTPMPTPGEQAAVSAAVPTMSGMASATSAASDPAMALLESLSSASTSGRGTPGGRGLMAGTSDAFQRMAKGLRSRGLDVVLVFDATNSMQPYVEQSKVRLHQIVEVIRGVIGEGEAVRNVRFGVVAFKDYSDDYGLDATRSLALTADEDEVHQFIDRIIPSGGMDLPEPIHEALEKATDRTGMKWRAGRQSLIILVTDAPVHPVGKKAAISEAASFARQLKGQVHVIDVGGSPAGGQATRQYVLGDLLEISEAGDGEAFLLQDEEQFWRELIVTIFGRRFERDVNLIVEKYTNEQPK